MNERAELIPRVDEGRAFLELQVEGARAEYLNLLTALQETYKTMKDVKADYEGYEGALVRHTRNSDDPYTPQPLPEISINLRISISEKGVGRSNVFTEVVQQGENGGGTDKKSSLDFSWDTKAGIIRNVFRELVTATYEDVLEALKGRDLKVPIDRGTLRRAVPKMVHRGEVRPLGDGRYEYLGSAE